MKENIYKAFSEVDTILEYSSEEIRNKVPDKFRQLIKKNKDNNYKLILDEHKKLKDQKLLIETREILSLIYRDYLCSEDERKELIKINNQKLEEINEEYDIQNIFDKRKNKVSTEDDINKETLPVVINEEKWYKKIFNFIRKLIKR